MASSKRIKEVARLKRRLLAGDPIAASNIAATYRQVGDYRQAYRWWRRAAGPEDGDSWLEVGFCRQYGIGTRRDPANAIRAYRQAIKTYHITGYDLEEAKYHLAVALLDRGRASDRRQAERWLEGATKDGDYSQAADLLNQLQAGEDLRICRCRRGLRATLGGRRQCERHGGQSNQRLHPTALGVVMKRRG